ncbi:MAG: DUF4179 domain-containing protein [Anaerovorax sp.]
MRSTDERMIAVKQRKKELKQGIRVRRNRMIGFSSITASLVVIVGLGCSMPGIIGKMASVKGFHVSGVASIFSSGNGGYVMIALLAFTLGVCVTVLCMYLHRRTTETAFHHDKEDSCD